MARLTAADGAGPSSQTPSPAPSSGPVSSRHSSSAHGAGGSGSAAARRRTSHPPPSPSSTSQSGADDDDDDDAADFADDFSSAPFRLSSRRNTIKARSAADVLAVSPQTSGSSMMDAEGSSAAAYYEPSPSPSELPHEILLHIFKYVAHRPADLFRCLLVCKAWCLCGVELLWHRPAFPNMDTLELFTHVLEAPDTTFEYASFVRRLSFAGIVNDVRDEHFLPFRVCHRLERLALAGCKALSNDAIVEALQHLRGIVAADLTDLVQLEDSAIEMLYKTCARLQGLNLSGCAKVTSGAVAALAKTCTLLRRVKLCGCVGIGDEAFAALTMHCPVLLEVDVAGCALISDISVRELWRRAFHIRELRLAHCGALTDLAFPAPNSVFQNTLRTGPSALHQTGWGGIESAPASRGTSPVGGMAAGHLTLRHASSGDGLFPRTATLPMPSPTMTHLAPPRTFDHLRILDITNCSTISDAAIEGIVTHVPRIKNLILAKCTRLTDDAVYSIAKLGKNLHYLHLGHVSNITDRAVSHLARACTRLRYIDLACCPQLTDVSVFELAANLPKLRRIGLVRVSNITDQAIYSLVDRHTSLERVHLSYCENISVPAVFWLLQRLLKLTHLSLTGIPAFRRPELQEMCRDPPEDFNDHQRSAFCVYSGDGVGKLRDFLHDVYREDGEASREYGVLMPEVQRAIASLEQIAASGTTESRDARHRSSEAARAVAAAAGVGGGPSHHGLHRMERRHPRSSTGGGGAGGEGRTSAAGADAAAGWQDEEEGGGGAPSSPTSRGQSERVAAYWRAQHTIRHGGGAIRSDASSSSSRRRNAESHHDVARHERERGGAVPMDVEPSDASASTSFMRPPAEEFLQGAYHHHPQQHAMHYGAAQRGQRASMPGGFVWGPYASSAPEASSSSRGLHAHMAAAAGVGAGTEDEDSFESAREGGGGEAASSRAAAPNGQQEHQHQHQALGALATPPLHAAFPGQEGAPQAHVDEHSVRRAGQRAAAEMQAALDARAERYAFESRRR